jgi:cytochrome c-type biogenesis protein CcmH/NrfG
VRRETVERARALMTSGNAHDAVAILGAAIQQDPAYPPYLAFLALALFYSSHPRQALGTMLHCVLEAAPDALDGFQAALGEEFTALICGT